MAICGTRVHAPNTLSAGTIRFETSGMNFAVLRHFLEFLRELDIYATFLEPLLFRVLVTRKQCSFFAEEFSL